MNQQIDTPTIRLIACTLNMAQRIEGMGNAGAIVNKLAAFDRRHATHFSRGWDAKGTQGIVDRVGTGEQFNCEVRRIALGQIFGYLQFLVYGLQQEVE